MVITLCGGCEEINIRGKQLEDLILKYVNILCLTPNSPFILG